MRRVAVSAWSAAVPTAPLALTLTACGSSGSGHVGSSGSPSATSTHLTSAHLAAAGRGWPACMWKHGIPDFPDMVRQDGQLSRPTGSRDTFIGTPLAHKRSRFASADQACKHYLAGMPEGIPIS